MAYTQADLDAIEAAIKTGALEVQHGNKRVRYESREALMRTRAFIERKLQPTKARPYGMYASFSRGIEAEE